MTEQTVAAPETREQKRTRHDAHLLHLLENFSRGIDELDVRYSTENEHRGKNSLRFAAAIPDTVGGHRDNKNYIQIGLSRVTNTRPFNQGYPVLHFFCFYLHQSDLAETREHFTHQDCLYNSALYYYRLPLVFSRRPVHCLYPYNQTLLQRLVKGMNDLGRSPKVPLNQFLHSDDPNHNFRIDRALQEAVFKAVVHLGKQEDCRNIVGVALK